MKENSNINWGMEIESTRDAYYYYISVGRYDLAASEKQRLDWLRDKVSDMSVFTNR